MVALDQSGKECLRVIIKVTARTVNQYIVTRPHEVFCWEEGRVREVVVCPEGISDGALYSGRDIVRESDI